MKLKFYQMTIQIYAILCFIYYVIAKQENCPRVQTYFDFQDLNDQLGHKEVTAITHIQGSTLVAVGTRVGAIEIWDYDSREIITKFFEERWPISRIDHIWHTNHILVRYQKKNGNQVSIWDLVTQERVQWLVDQDDKLDDYSEVVNYQVIDTYLSRNGNYFLQMSIMHVVACDINSVNTNSTKPDCLIYPLADTIKQEQPLYIFSFDSQFQEAFFILTKLSIYKVNRLGLSINQKLYRVDDVDNVKIIDMIRTQQDGIIMIALSTNELITLNLQTNNGSEKIYKLRDYLQYISLDQLIILKEVKSFFSESLVLITFEAKNENSDNFSQKQFILTYNIEEDKVLQFETTYSVKLIAPINQSRSFIVAYYDDTLGWYAYPIIQKSIQSLASPLSKISSKSVDLQSNYKKQIVNESNQYFLQDDLQGGIVFYSISEDVIKKRVNMTILDKNTYATALSIIFLDDQEQFLVITSELYLLIYSYQSDKMEPLYIRDISSYITQNQNNISNTFLIKLKHTNSSIALINSQLFLIFDFVSYQIVHYQQMMLNPDDIFLDCDLIYDSKTSISNTYNYHLIINGKDSFKILNLAIVIQDGQVLSNINQNINSQIANKNIIGWIYLKIHSKIVTQDSRNQFCQYSFPELEQISCFKIWYDESDFNTVSKQKRGLLSTYTETTIIAQLNDFRVVFIDLYKQQATFSTCKFDTYFFQIAQLKQSYIFLIPAAISKKKVSFLDQSYQNPSNYMRNMKGVIQESKLYRNQIVLNMKDGSFKVLDVEKYSLQEIVIADPRYQETRKFIIDQNTLIYIDEINIMQVFIFEDNFNSVYNSDKFLIEGIKVTNTSNLELTSIKNVIALIGDQQILYINYNTHEIFPIYKTQSQKIVTTDFNSTLSLIVIGLSDNTVEILNVEDIHKPYITYQIQANQKINTVHHSIMFLNRVYFTYSNSIIRWDVDQNRLSEVCVYDFQIKSIIFVVELQAIAIFLENGVVQIINDDINSYYYINVYALTQSYANVDQLIYMQGLNSLAFISDHRIWALTLHSFADDDEQNSQSKIECEKGFYIESMSGQEYYNILGKGNLVQPYKKVSAIRKETIKIGKSHKIFLYNKIKLNFYLQEGKIYELEEPFQYATQKINSIVTFQTYETNLQKQAGQDQSVNKKASYYYEKSNLITTTLSIKDSYRFENIQKLFFYNMNIQLKNQIDQKSDVRYTLFNNIDQISFIGCNFYQINNNYDAYIFEGVKILKFYDVKIKQSQFITNNVTAIYMEQVQSSLIPPTDSQVTKKKCLTSNQVLFLSDSQQSRLINEQIFKKQVCKYYFFYPVNQQSYIFIEVTNQEAKKDQTYPNSQEISNQTSSIDQLFNITDISYQSNNTVLNFSSQNQLVIDQFQQIKLQNYKNIKQNEFQKNQDQYEKLDLTKWASKQNVDLNEEDSYLKLNETLYSLNNCTFQYANIFTFLTEIQNSNNNQSYEQSKYYLSPQLNISNSLITQSTIFGGQEIEQDQSQFLQYDQVTLKHQYPSLSLFQIRNHIINKSSFIKVNLYDSNHFKINKLSQLRLVNSYFNKTTLNLGNSNDNLINDILIYNSTFESIPILPLFDLGQRFQLRSIYLQNNIFLSQIIFQFKSQFNNQANSNNKIDQGDESNDDTDDTQDDQNKFEQFQQPQINNSTVIKLFILNCTMNKTNVFSFNELLLKSYFKILNFTIFKVKMVETSVIDLMSFQKGSKSLIQSLNVDSVATLRSCFIRKLSDQILLIKDVNIHKSFIRYTNFLQTKRPFSPLVIAENYLINAFSNLIVNSTYWFNSKIAELAENSLLLFSDSFIKNNTFVSEMSSYERQSKYLVELDHLIVQNVEIYQNQFLYQLFCGPPSINNQYIDYNLKKINITNNTFTGQSNGLFAEATFSIISTGSQVELGEIIMEENCRKDSGVSKTTFLVEGYKFFFFYFDKVLNTKVTRAEMNNNKDIGFGVFKNSIGQNMIDSLIISNQVEDSKDLNINQSTSLKQPILIIRNGANFIIQNSIVRNLRIYNSPVFEIESNKNFYIQINDNSTLEQQNQETIAMTNFRNVTFENNAIQIDPYVCLGSFIEYTSNLITKFGLFQISFISNVIKGLNQNSQIQAQINVQASQSDVVIQNSTFNQNKDFRFVKNMADSIFLQIEARAIGIFSSQFLSAPNNQTDEGDRNALKFNLQIIGLLNYQMLKFQHNFVSQMRSQTFAMLELATLSDAAFTLIQDCEFEDMIPKTSAINIKGSLFSNKIQISNCTFSNIYNQIIQIDRIKNVSLVISDNRFYQIFSLKKTILDISNQLQQSSSISFYNNFVEFSNNEIQESINYYNKSVAILAHVKSVINGARSLMNLTSASQVFFSNNKFSGYNSESVVLTDKYMIQISNIKQLYLQSNTFQELNNAFISTLVISNIENAVISNLTISKCNSLDLHILKLSNIKNIQMKDIYFHNNTLQSFSKIACIQVKNTCFQAKNIQIIHNHCSSFGPLAIQFNRLAQDSSCKIQHSDQYNSSVVSYQTISSISDSIISSNFGLDFGGLVIQNTVQAMLSINNTLIQKNNAQKGSGGGIFLHVVGTHNFFIENTTISQNQAYYRGGGIYVEEDIPETLFKLNNNLVFGNISPQNLQICSSGRVANFKIFTDQYQKEHSYLYQNQSNLLAISDQQSGGELPTILAQILDYKKQIVLPYLNPQLNKASLSLSQNAQNCGYYLQGQLEVQYDLSKGGFLFQNITIYGKPDTLVHLIFTTQMIEFDGINSTIKLQTDYKIQISVQLRRCIVGETYFNNNLYQSCQPCPEKQYSLEDPYLNQNINCLDCPKFATCLGRNLLSINSGFWRKDNTSLDIIYCGTEPRNCLGGIYAGDESCSEDMIGPLCEQCDIENGYTNISSSKCLACSDIGWTLTIILSVLLFFLIYILISIDSTVRRIKHSRSISSKSKTNTVFVASMVVKLFITYLQVISIIGTFQLNINPFATQGTLSLGNPILSFSNAMDCYLYDLGKKIGVNHIYLNFFASLLIPVTFMLLISLVDYLNNRKNYYYRSYFCKTMFLVILLFFAPLAFQNGLKLITCRKVGQDSYISYNMLFQCLTPEYFRYSIMVVTPLIFVFCVIVPLVLAILIKKRKQRKVSIKTYQYLLGDYKETTYFWEFVKYTQKLTIMLISVYFSQDIKTKALLINFILIIYGTTVFFVKPFRTEILNRLDIFTTLIIFLSVHLGLMAYEQENQNVIQWYICIILLTVMNLPLFFWYIYTIFKCYAPWFAMKKRNLKNKLMRFRIFRSNQNPKERAQFNWKNLYKKYIESMKAQKYGGRQLDIQSQNDNEFDHIPFLRNKKDISFHSENTDINFNLTKEEECTNRSEALSEYDEESPVKILNLQFRKKIRKSFESPKAKDQTAILNNRKRYNTTSQATRKRKLSNDLLNETQVVHSRFSQLVQDLKDNQQSTNSNLADQSNEIKREKSKESDNYDNIPSQNEI
ncbi:hypothetical protein ABPG74_008199 [Tetrahymena malaccensis]